MSKKTLTDIRYPKKFKMRWIVIDLLIVILLIIILFSLNKQSNVSNGITIIGPNKVGFNKIYNYKIEVRSDVNADNADLIITNTNSGYSTNNNFNLKAHKIKDFKFNTSFLLYAKSQNDFLVASLVLPADNNHSHQYFLYQKTLPIIHSKPLKNDKIEYNNVPYTKSGLNNEN